jgi:hypothetical protein
MKVSKPYPLRTACIKLGYGCKKFEEEIPYSIILCANICSNENILLKQKFCKKITQIFPLEFYVNSSSSVRQNLFYIILE